MTGGVYLPACGWGDKPVEQRIRIAPAFVVEAIERIEWLEQLRDMVGAGEIKQRVARNTGPSTQPMHSERSKQEALAAGR